jgi:hypothetical protein
MPNIHSIPIHRRFVSNTLLVALGSFGAALAAPAESAPKQVDLGTARASREVQQVANGALASGDNAGRSIVILDKRNARVFVFDPKGKLRGTAPALLGMARGDHTVPGIGTRKIADVLPHERTTPAGRFVAEIGMSSTRGEDVVWVDYDSAVSMHRVIKGTPKERRAQRLASPTSTDNRISYGCINLPVSFYEQTLSPAVKNGGAIIYVLPETRPAHELFGFLAAERRAAP